MSELIKVEQANVQKYDDKTFSSLSTAASYLPRFQLVSSSSNLAKEGTIQVGHYAMTAGDKSTDLGKEIDVVPVYWQPRAIRLEGGAVTMSLTDRESEEFKKIFADSATQDSGCMAGPEFLLWIPSEKKFATYLCGSKSAQYEADSIRSCIGNAATFRSKLKKGSKFSWQVPVVTPCSTPVTDLPTKEEVNDAMVKFASVTNEKVETVDEPGRAR